jgi:hypothetical protein
VFVSGSHSHLSLTFVGHVSEQTDRVESLYKLIESSHHVGPDNENQTNFRSTLKQSYGGYSLNVVRTFDDRSKGRDTYYKTAVFYGFM